MCRKPSTSSAAAAAAAAARYRLAGDALHSVLLGCIAAYGVALSRLLRESRGGDGIGGETNDSSYRNASSWFDPEWLRHGFCMPHDDVPFLSTHERSGIVMIAISVLGAVLVLSLNASSIETQRARRRVVWALVGAVGHACGHVILAVTNRSGLLPDGSVSAMDEFFSPDANLVTYAKHLPGYFMFWIPLVKTYMYNVSGNNVALFAFLMMAVAMQLPLKFGFSYTLIVLFAGQSLDQLFLPGGAKGFDYALWPMLTLLPSFCISAMEGAWCTESRVFGTHGHLIFDGYMALSYSLYYLVCWLWSGNEFFDAKAKKVL